MTGSFHKLHFTNNNSEFITRFLGYLHVHVDIAPEVGKWRKQRLAAATCASSIFFFFCIIIETPSVNKIRLN